MQRCVLYTLIVFFRDGFFFFSVRNEKLTKSPYPSKTNDTTEKDERKQNQSEERKKTRSYVNKSNAKWQWSEREIELDSRKTFFFISNVNVFGA